MVLPAVLHPDVADFLRTDRKNNLDVSVWKCIEKLRNRLLDNGLRVKKLQGIAKNVWEARVTKDVRLLFTYAKSRHPETGKPQVYIAVEDLCLDHDDVSLRAKARKRTPDATWLDAREIDVVGRLEGDYINLSPDERSALDTAQAEDLQISPDEVDELLGNIQWRVLDSEEKWQLAIIQQTADLPLKLTPEEYELVNLYGNLFVSGSAGTGKTTVGLYRLLKSLETLPAGKRLYVAYNPFLVKEVSNQFKRLVGAKNAEFEAVFQFKTIRDLCFEILGSAGQSYIAEDEVNYQIFDQLYRQPERHQYPPALVWDEIRSLIKGSQLDPNVKLLTQTEYERLGKKKASVIPYNKRSNVYKLAEWYQKRLERDKRFDEIDLARRVLQIIKQGKGDRYQMIVCDEVQDFTELQLDLLVRLVTSEGGLFFAGDLNQMISPSGFRWEDLRTNFYMAQRKVVEKPLNFNFRSFGSLVNLANQLLTLRSRLLKERISSPAQPISIYGESARLIVAPKETLQSTLKQLDPDDAILVRTDADKNRFTAEFKSSFVFTIEEAKGLEFDTVFLVDFFNEHQSLWDKVWGGKVSLREQEIPELRLELNLLYVAVTRARRILNIWETQLAELWNQVELVRFVQSIDAESVRDGRIEPTRSLWRDRGFYYRDAGFFRQAIECFEKAGETSLKRQTLANLLLLERKYAEAAEVFIELQDWQRAAQSFEKGQQWQQAADCWRRFGNTEQQQICNIRAMEAASQWEEAASQWEAFGRLEDAKRCWLKSSNERKKAEIRAVEFEQQKQWLKAAKQYELVGMPEKSAACKAKDFESKKQWDNAATQYELAGMPEKVAECNTKNNRKSGGASINLVDNRGAIENHTKAIHINPNNAEAYYNRGNAYSELGDNQAALSDLNQAIQLNPEYAIAYNDRGIVSSELGNNQAALSDFNQAIKLKPDDAEAYCNRGVVYSELGNNQAALSDYNQAIKLDTDLAVAYYNRGVIYYSDLGNKQAALSDYNQAIKLNPDYAEAYGNRGNVYSDLGNKQAALSDYNQVIKLNPDLAVAYFSRGNVCSDLGNKQAALSDYNQAIKLNPGLADAYNNRGLVYNDLGNKQAALSDYNQAIKLQPDNAVAYFNRGVLYNNLGNKQAALSDYNQVIKLQPDNATAYFNRGNVYNDLGNKQAALSDYNQVIKLQPDNATAYFNRGNVYSDLGNKQAVLSDYNQAIKLNPDNAEAYCNRGVLYRDLGNKQAALSDFNQAIKLQPDLALAYYNRGVLYNDLGNKQAALSDYNQAIKLNPDNADAYSNRGFLFSELGNKQAALSDYNQAIKLNPDLAEPYYNRGVLYNDLGNKQAALSDFTKARDFCQAQGNNEWYNYAVQRINGL